MKAKRRCMHGKRLRRSPLNNKTKDIFNDKNTYNRSLESRKLGICYLGDKINTWRYCEIIKTFTLDHLRTIENLL